ncbi:MAG: excinuclease ABC subunit UvrC [Nitriliruptoraceae bacterium]
MENPALAFRPAPGTIPDAPGCYLFHDDRDRVLYVGKAKSLRSRLASYFGAWDGLPERTRGMLASARRVEWMVVDSEAAALHLEWTLIQHHRPRHNVRFRDDKSYPELVLTTSDEVPRARVQRGRVAAGDRRFGPYVSAADARATLDLLLRVFPVRTCSDGVYERARRSDRPCLLHHIGRCAAPCTGEVDVAEHRELVAGLAAFLGGRTAPVLSALEADMRAAAAEQRFEAAAVLRDRLEAARRVTERQQVVRPHGEDLDALAVEGDELEAAVHVFMVRGGRLVGQTGWVAERQDGGDLGVLVTSCLLRLYGERPDDVPPVVLVPAEPEDGDALADLLSERRGGRVRIAVPQRGERRAFLELVGENARQALGRTRLRRATDLAARSAALEELRDRLDLPEAPLRIECFDISHLAGTGVVASMVVFEDGLPRRDAYRRFKLRVDANDDPAAMREVVRRRFERLLRERAEPLRPDDRRRRGFATAPDLVIVDGGPTQLAAALEGVEDLPLEGVSFAALAKRLEELWRPGRSAPVLLPRGSEALYLVQRVRDEAHRVAITYQRGRRTASVRGSSLEDVPGVGPARRRALLRTFGSVAGVRAAADEELLAVPGVSPTLVAALRDHLGGPEDAA